MLIRKTGIGVTLAATLVLATSHLTAQGISDRFSFAVAGVKGSKVNRAYAQADPKNGSIVTPEKLNFSITRYASDAERDRLFSVASSEGTGKVPDALGDMPAAGYVSWPGGSSYTIRYARRAPRPDGGHDLVLITDGRVHAWWRSDLTLPADDRFSVIQVRLNSQGVGEAKVSAGSAVTANKDAGVMLSDYGRAPVVFADVRQEAGMDSARS